MKRRLNVYPRGIPISSGLHGERREATGLRAVHSRWTFFAGPFCFVVTLIVEVLTFWLAICCFFGAAKIFAWWFSLALLRPSSRTTWAWRGGRLLWLKETRRTGITDSCSWRINDTKFSFRAVSANCRSGWACLSSVTLLATFERLWLYPTAPTSGTRSKICARINAAFRQEALVVMDNKFRKG